MCSTKDAPKNINTGICSSNCEAQNEQHKTNSPKGAAQNAQYKLCRAQNMQQKICSPKFTAQKIRVKYAIHAVQHKSYCLKCAAQKKYIYNTK